MAIREFNIEASRCELTALDNSKKIDDNISIACGFLFVTL
jgi:hypothetical protein